MNFEQAKQKILRYHWEPWLKRPFYGFLTSTFRKGNTKKAFKEIGLPGWEYESFVFSDGEWYQAEEVYQKAKPAILAWLKRHPVREITRRLETDHKKWKIEVKKMSEKPGKDTLKKFKRLADILRIITTYIWATHALEHFFMPLLNEKVAKFTKGDVEKFIGDASFPDRPNATGQMLLDFKNGVDVDQLAKTYGWMRARDGFTRPYSRQEISAIIKHALTQTEHKRPKIPGALAKIFTDSRELVFLRTQRTDVYYELIYLAQPFLKRLAKKNKIPYAKLKYYDVESLITGNPRAYPENFACFAYKDHTFLQKKPLFSNNQHGPRTELAGAIAQMGKVAGPAKVLLDVKELGKVKKGDILVTYMTSPNFLPAMKLAAGFVTDEGGLTCHAAIVAREMKKPCVIGTRIATKIFKDGDLLEVDANKGIVRLIK